MIHDPARAAEHRAHDLAATEGLDLDPDELDELIAHVANIDVQLGLLHSAGSEEVLPE